MVFRYFLKVLHIFHMWNVKCSAWFSPINLSGLTSDYFIWLIYFHVTFFYDYFFSTQLIFHVIDMIHLWSCNYFTWAIFFHVIVSKDPFIFPGDCVTQLISFHIWFLYLHAIVSSFIYLTWFFLPDSFVFTWLFHTNHLFSRDCFKGFIRFHRCLCNMTHFSYLIHSFPRVIYLFDKSLFLMNDVFSTYNCCT